METLKLCKYYSKVLWGPKGPFVLQKDYLNPRNSGKCLGSAIEKKFLPYGASWGPPGPPLGLWATALDLLITINQALFSYCVEIVLYGVLFMFNSFSAYVRLII